MEESYLGRDMRGTCLHYSSYFVDGSRIRLPGSPDRLDLAPTELCPSSLGSSIFRSTLCTVSGLKLGISVHIASNHEWRSEQDLVSANSSISHVQSNTTIRLAKQRLQGLVACQRHSARMHVLATKR